VDRFLRCTCPAALEVVHINSSLRNKLCGIHADVVRQNKMVSSDLHGSVIMGSFVMHIVL